MVTTLVAAGIVVGTVQVLTGAGGGILALPLLLFAADLNVQTAAPIALMAVATSAAVASVSGLMAGIVRYRAAFVMAAFGWVASPAGVWLAHRISSNVLAVLFALVMLRNGWVVWRRSRSAAGPRQDSGDCACVLSPVTGRFTWTWRCASAFGRTGLAAGFLSGLLGVGGGFIVVPSLAKHTNLPMQAITATSLMVIGLVSLAAIGSSAALHGVDWRTAMPFMAGAVGATLVARGLGGRIPAPWVSAGFAALCVAVALVLLYRSFGQLMA
jgi:uncharacterized membrane protein YfcA